MRCKLEEEKTICNGPVKPKITFFGEKLPEKFMWGWDRILNKKWGSLEDNPPDLAEDGGCDLMITIGTALAVYPFSSTLMQAPKDCPQVLMNLTNTKDNSYDFEDLLENPHWLFLQGKCDDTVIKLCKDLGWYKELEALAPK